MYRQNNKLSQQVFDKPRIIAIMKTALRRLRQDKITIEQVIDEIIAQGIDMSRTNFEDLFTTRPTRVSGAPPLVLLATIHALFRLKRNVLTAREVMELATAARLPINLFGQIMEYFTMQEWQEIWYMYLPSTRKALEKKEIIGRDSVFARLYMYMQTNTHIVISGSQGIGKTALAYALVREYEINYHCRIPCIAVTVIPTSPKELFEIIATAFSIKPLYQEPIELRINSVLKSSQIYYLVLDNYPDSDNGAHQVILKMVLQRLPMLRVIITHRHANQFSQLSNCYEEMLEPLGDDDANSPAYQLFVRVLQANGLVENIFSMELLKQCQLAQGNPFTIQFIANTYASNKEYLGVAQGIQQLITTMSPTDAYIIEFITLCRQRVTLTLLKYYMHQVGIYDEQLYQALHQLVARGIITRTIINGIQAYMIHDVLTQALLQFDNQLLLTSQKITHILRRLITIMQLFSAGTMPILTHDDVQALVDLVQYIMKLHETYIIDIMKLLVEFELVWIHYAGAAQVIILAEHCIAKFTGPHPILIKMYALLGNLCNYRSLNETAAYYFEKALDHIDSTHEKKVWALVTLDYSFNLGRTLLLADQIAATHMALRVFQEHDMQYAYARSLDCLSRIYLQQGDIKNALQYSQLALDAFVGMTNTVGYLDALTHKALLYMVMSDYEMSRQLCVQIIHESETNNWAHLNAVAKLRIAGTIILEGNADQARYYLSQAATILLRLGNTGEILFVVDVYSFILLVEGRVHEALQFNDMSTLLRDHLNLPRGVVLDALVKTKRDSIFMHRGVEYTPLIQIHDIYEVINIIRTEL